MKRIVGAIATKEALSGLLDCYGPSYPEIRTLNRETRQLRLKADSVRNPALRFVHQSIAEVRVWWKVQTLLMDCLERP